MWVGLDSVREKSRCLIFCETRHLCTAKKCSFLNIPLCLPCSPLSLLNVWPADTRMWDGCFGKTMCTRAPVCVFFEVWDDLHSPHTRLIPMWQHKTRLCAQMLVWNIGLTAAHRQNSVDSLINEGLFPLFLLSLFSPRVTHLCFIFMFVFLISWICLIWRQSTVQLKLQNRGNLWKLTTSLNLSRRQNQSESRW